MLVLVIDTSCAATTVALASVPDADTRAVELLACRVSVDARGHAEILAPAIDACLREAGAGVGELAAVVAGVGPGPFTGLRVGLMTAAVLAQVLAIPAYAVCSLDGIGAVAGAGRVLVASDARRREVYWAGYLDGQRQGEPQVSKPMAVHMGDFEAIAGAGARLYADVFELPLRLPDYPDPAALIATALPRLRARAASEALTPLYLRRPDATELPVPAARTEVVR